MDECTVSASASEILRATSNSADATVKLGMFPKYGEEVPKSVFDCSQASVVVVVLL